MEERYVVKTEWYDPQASLLREYQLTFYPKDNTIEMYDVKNRRLFLKRSEFSAITMDKIFMGAILCRREF